MRNNPEIFLRLQVIHKHEKIAWQKEISSLIFTLIEQKPIKSLTFDLKKYIEAVPQLDSSLSTDLE